MSELEWGCLCGVICSNVFVCVRMRPLVSVQLYFGLLEASGLEELSVPSTQHRSDTPAKILHPELLAQSCDLLLHPFHISSLTISPLLVPDLVLHRVQAILNHKDDVMVRGSRALPP